MNTQSHHAYHEEAYAFPPKDEMYDWQTEVCYSYTPIQDDRSPGQLATSRERVLAKKRNPELHKAFGLWIAVIRKS